MITENSKYNLPLLTAIEVVTFETILQENIEIMQKLLKDWVPVESDPYMIILESISYKELQNRLNDNEKIRKMIPHLTSGDDLDVILFSYFGGIKRLENENDEDFLDRAILSLNRNSTAGAYKTYEYYTYSANETIEDVKVLNGLKPLSTYVPLFLDKNEDEILKALFKLVGDMATVEVYIASKNEITQQVIDDVITMINDEKIRPLTDRVLVKPASKKDLVIDIDLEIYDLNNQELIQENISKNFNQLFKIGENLIYSELISKLHINGVYKVVTNISNDVVVSNTEVLKVSLNFNFRKNNSSSEMAL